jgi:hypothetical protein
MIAIAKRILSGVHLLTAGLHFAWALVLFAIAVWIPQVLDSSGWVPYFFSAWVAWYGISSVRTACEELLLDRSQKTQSDPRQRNPMSRGGQR